MLQYGRRFKGLSPATVVYNRSLKKFQRVEEFYETSAKVSLDCLVEPQTTMIRHPVAANITGNPILKEISQIILKD